jgi:superfamily II DNA or RNA helicase
LGVIGGGKKKPSGKIDIAVMQSLSRREDQGGKRNRGKCAKRQSAHRLS